MKRDDFRRVAQHESARRIIRSRIRHAGVHEAGTGPARSGLSDRLARQAEMAAINSWTTEPVAPLIEQPEVLIEPEIQVVPLPRARLYRADRTGRRIAIILIAATVGAVLALAGSAHAQGAEAERVDAAMVRSGLVKHLTQARRRELVRYMVAAGNVHDMDPLLIAAVAWIESRWTNLKVNRTRDRGVLQVHWQPREPWLKGIKRSDLRNDRINILVGTAELAHMRAWCRRKRHTIKQHHWVAHYLYGPNVRGRRYDRGVQFIHRKLQRADKRKD